MWGVVGETGGKVKRLGRPRIGWENDIKLEN